MSDYSHTILRSIDEIAAERDSWNAIVSEEYDGNPFLTMEWNELWLKHFCREDTEIRYVKLVNRKGRVAGYVPLILERQQFHGFSVQALRLASNIYSPITCPIVRSAEAVATLGSLVDEVLPTLRWQVLTATGLPMEYCGAAELHTALLDSGLKSSLNRAAGNWVFHERGISSTEYLSRLHRKLRADIRRDPKRLESHSTLRFLVSDDQLTQTEIENYQRVYSSSWKEPEIDPTFHPNLMIRFAATGWLRLGFLLVDDRPIAAHLWLVAGNHAYGVKLAYDKEFRQYSPGTILMWYMCERLIDVDRVETLDLLIGDDHYKSYWCNRRRQRLAITCFAKGLRGSLLHKLDQSWLPWIRRNRLLNAIKKRVAGLMVKNDDD